MDARIPQIGLGTMTLKGDICVQAVKTALQLGYRHIDTAWFYGNEKEVGEGIAPVRRQARGHFPLHQGAREHTWSRKSFAKSLDESLANLQVPYVDLLLIHWNNKDIPFKTSASARSAKPRRTAKPNMSASPISPPRCWTRPGR